MVSPSAVAATPNSLTPTSPAIRWDETGRPLESRRAKKPASEFGGLRRSWLPSLNSPSKEPPISTSPLGDDLEPFGVTNDARARAELGRKRRVRLQRGGRFDPNVVAAAGENV